MSVDYVPAGSGDGTGYFLLTGAASAYAFAHDADGHLWHLHWGGRVQLDDLPGLLARPVDEYASFGSVPRGYTEELVAWGGRRFDESTLVVGFADGTRGLELRYAGHEIDGDGLRVRLADAHYRFDVVLDYRVHPGYDVLVRWLELTNRTDATVTLDQAYSASWALPPGPAYRASWLHGAWGAETHLVRRALAPGRLVLESRTGTTGHQHQPWLAVDDGSATEGSGEVWSVALAYSGSWKLTAQLSHHGGLHVTGGVNDFDFRYPLAPGETLVLPEFVGLHTGAGFGSASRQWHAYTRAHVVAEPELTRPVLFNSWEATAFEVSHSGQLALAKQAAELGVELFVVDDGWFGARDDDTAGLGDWTPNPRKFPRGLAAFADDIHALGMKFGLWVEPEMVNPDSDLYRRHPDWIYHFPNRTRTTARNQSVLNLARPDVRDWMYSTLDGLLRSAPIDYLKWDMNRSISEPGGSADDRPVWLAHVRHLYEVLDRLRAGHPGVLIESCSGGGGRADLGILRRTYQVWTSDNTDALDRLRTQEGYSQLYPANTMSCWATDVPNFLTRRSIPLRFRFHAAMCGNLGIGGDLADWSAEELAEAAGYVALYKRIRPTVQFGVQYRLASLDDGGVAAVSYVGADGDVVVFTFVPSAHNGERHRTVRLAGLDPTAVYSDVDTDERYSGGLLTHRGLYLRLEGDYASAVTVLRRG
jgi:alpha-galactosidase